MKQLITKDVMRVDGKIKYFIFFSRKINGELKPVKNWNFDNIYKARAKFNEVLLKNPTAAINDSPKW